MPTTRHNHRPLTTMQAIVDASLAQEFATPCPACDILYPTPKVNAR